MFNQVHFLLSFGLILRLCPRSKADS
jgi:hypothetical protein